MDSIAYTAQIMNSETTCRYILTLSQSEYTMYIVSQKKETPYSFLLCTFIKYLPSLKICNLWQICNKAIIKDRTIHQACHATLCNINLSKIVLSCAFGYYLVEQDSTQTHRLVERRT